MKGEVNLDFRDALEYVDLPRLETIETLRVRFRTQNVDLNGLNEAAAIGVVTLVNDIGPNDGQPLLNGLNGVTSLRTLRVEGGSIQNPEANNGDPADGGFLESLELIAGDVTIEANGMDHIYGLGNTTRVTGDGSIIVPAGAQPALIDLRGTGRLDVIEGTLTVHGVDSLTSLDGLDLSSANRLVLEDNRSLENIDALTGLAVGTSVRILGNTALSCSAVNNFVSNLPDAVSATTDC